MRWAITSAGDGHQLAKQFQLYAATTHTFIHLLLLFSMKGDIHFTVPRKVRAGCLRLIFVLPHRMRL